MRGKIEKIKPDARVYKIIPTGPLERLTAGGWVKMGEERKGDSGDKKIFSVEKLTAGGWVKMGETNPGKKTNVVKIWQP